jgi:hypothetical protein
MPGQVGTFLRRRRPTCHRRQACAVCDEPIAAQDVECEIQHGVALKLIVRHFHRRRYAVWDWSATAAETGVEPIRVIGAGRSTRRWAKISGTNRC